jgi:hypothetical protein
MKSGDQTSAFFSIPTTVLLLSACLAVASLTACAPRLTAPAPDVAAGAVDGTGYRFLRWKEGLAIIIWYDFRGDSGSSSTSSGGDLGSPSTYTIHGYAESEDGDRFEWEVETSDGKSARFRIDGRPYDLSQGTLFIVSTADGLADVTQLERGLSGVEPNHTSVAAFARGNAELAPLVGAAPPSSGESPLPTPVQIPSNPVTVETTSPSASSDGYTLEEAEGMIREHLWNQRPFFSRDLHIPIQELPVPEIREHLPVQIFRVTDGLFARETFLIEGDTVVRLGSAEGGRGVTSLKVSDLDWDGTAEVLFTYSSGSPVYHSRIGMVAPAYGETRTYEAGTAYLGDVALVKDGMTHVVVKAVAPDDETATLRYGETLGLLVIHEGEDEVKLELHVAEGLPDDLIQNLVSISALPELAPDTSVDSHRGIRFAFDHTIADQAVAEVAPGPVEGAPSWAAQPAHVQFSFVGYALPTRFPAPRLIVYPVARFEEVNEGAAATIADLRRLLADTPASPDTIPFLPPFSASQMMRPGGVRQLPRRRRRPLPDPVRQPGPSHQQSGGLLRLPGTHRRRGDGGLSDPPRLPHHLARGSDRVRRQSRRPRGEL